MNEKQLQEQDRQAALEELYAILADEAYSTDYDPDAPYETTDTLRGQWSTDIAGW